MMPSSSVPNSNIAKHKVLRLLVQTASIKVLLSDTVQAQKIPPIALFIKVSFRIMGMELVS
ncbi:hypothetical protein D932_02397 [Enterococcus casseliflavus 14-MB-W-14]|nr:hypothetical protein D932_02397 [Enterococcus casseliflavus 14-MB-W-14]